MYFDQLVTATCITRPGTVRRRRDVASAEWSLTLLTVTPAPTVTSTIPTANLAPAI